MSELRKVQAALEARYLAAELNRLGGNMSAVAAAAGVDRTTIYRKLKQGGIDLPHAQYNRPKLLLVA
jgi:transcriptional regulator of acetoin/glycerol metabolism